MSKKLIKFKSDWSNRIFASKCRVVDNSEVMLIKSQKLSVCPITTHINIKEVSKKLIKKLYK